MRRRILAGWLLGLFLASATLISVAQEVIKLPAPQTDKPGKSVMQALQLRRSTRDYGTGEIFVAVAFQPALGSQWCEPAGSGPE